MKTSFLFLVALGCSTIATASRYGQCLWRPKKLTREFCERPPVAQVVPSSYLGTWYQIYVNAEAQFTSPKGCVTANYSSVSQGIGVLNCFDNGRNSSSCLPGIATRPGSSPARLRVNFGGSGPGGPYNIAALLGAPEYGYYAAAVFSCRIRKGRPSASWFILARLPYRPKRILREMRRKLRCKGYNIYRERLFPTRQGRGCNYFYGPGGFNTFTRENSPTGRRPN